MAKYYVDYSGYCIIEANTMEEAEQEFWNQFDNLPKLPDEIVEIEGIERQEII